MLSKTGVNQNDLVEELNKEHQILAIIERTSKMNKSPATKVLTINHIQGVAWCTSATLQGPTCCTHIGSHIHKSS